MSNIKVVHPLRGWADLLLPQDEVWPDTVQGLARLPGIRVNDSRISIPRNAWDLDIVKRFTLEHARCDLTATAYRRTVAMLPSNVALYAHQQEAAQIAVEEECLLLGDDMGMGKTRVAAVAAIGYRQIAGPHRPILIIAPKFTREVHRRELRSINAISSDEEFFALSTRKPQPIPEDVQWIFCHYDIVRAWWPRIWERRPVACIVDEAHWIRNGRTQRSRGTSVAAAACPFRILLTGTPMLNRPAELWHLLSVTTGPHSWGGPLQFRKRYCGAIHDGYGHRDQTPTNTRELSIRMRSCYLRRTIAESGLSLPPLTRRQLNASLADTDKEVHDGLLSEIYPETIMEILATGRGSHETLRLLGSLRKLTSNAKIKTTVQYVTDCVEAGESVVVFVWERRMTKRIATAVERATRHLDMPLPTVINGSMDQTARDETVARFQKDGGVLVATFGSLGVGVTLHRARMIVMHDLDWTPATVLQAEARVFRIGQDRPVISAWVVADDSIDELLADVLMAKADAIGQVLNDTAPTEALQGVGLEGTNIEAAVNTWLDQVMGVG